MSTIHWDSRNAWGLMPPRAVQLWCIYAAMANREGVAWPSIEGLRKALGVKNRETVIEARRWLIEHAALEVARGYIPPQERHQLAGHDQRLFVRITGTVTVGGAAFTLLYAPGDVAGSDSWRGGSEISDGGRKNPTSWSEISDGGGSEISDPNVVKEEDSRVVEPPPYEPPKVLALRNDTFAQANGWQLVDAYGEVTSVVAEAIWADTRTRKVAAALASAQITPEDVRAFVRDLKRNPERSNGYRFTYLAEDLPRWKQQQTAKLAPRRETAAEKAAREAQDEADTIAWRREMGIIP